LKEHQAGLSAQELCRKYGVSDATFYKWRSKYGGMDVSDARKLKSLEDENRRLKKLLAESMLRVSAKVCASDPWRVDRHRIVVGKRSVKKMVNWAYAARHSMAGFQCTPRFLSAR
jgi:putative transposase